MPLPKPDLSDIDFSFRPVIHPKPLEEIDEDYTLSRLQSVAYCWLGYSMHGDGVSVDVDISEGRYKYIVYADDMDMEEFPDGEVSEESGVPLSLGELLLLIETPIYEDMWIHSPFSCYWYEALDGEPLPVSTMKTIEISSDFYPDLPKFYTILNDHFVSICRETGALPNQEEWMEMVADVIEIGPK